MADVLQWSALSLVIIQLYLMGSNYYRAGWAFAIMACFAWGGYSYLIESAALGAQQVVIAVLSIRALKNLED